MVSFNFYGSEKKKPELVAALLELKAQDLLSEFIIESCEVNLPLFLERKIAENEAQAKYFAELKKTHGDAKKSVLTRKDDKKNDYLKTLPRDRDRKGLLGMLTGPGHIDDWKRAGFTSAFEVVEALDKLKKEEVNE